MNVVFNGIFTMTRLQTLRNRMLNKGQMLAEYLNGSEGLPKQSRVVRLLKLCQKLCEVLPSVKPSKYMTTEGRRVYFIDKDRTAKKVLNEINRLMRCYRYRRLIEQSILVAPGERPSFSVVTVCVNPGTFSKRGHEQITEGNACEIVLDLAEAGFLWVRRCQNPKCHKWFMAKRPNQLNHEMGCYKAEYAKTYRKRLMKRNPNYFKDKMREYRDLHGSDN